MLTFDASSRIVIAVQHAARKLGWSVAFDVDAVIGKRVVICFAEPANVSLRQRPYWHCRCRCHMEKSLNGQKAYLMRWDIVSGSYLPIKTRSDVHPTRSQSVAAIAAARRDPTSAEARQRRRDYQRLLQRIQRGFKRVQAAALVQAAATMGKDVWRLFKPKQQIEPSISKNQWFSHCSALLGEAPSEGSSDPGDAHAPRAADGSDLSQPLTAAEIVGIASKLRRGSATLGFGEDHRCTENLLILRTVIEQQCRKGSLLSAICLPVSCH